MRASWVVTKNGTEIAEFDTWNGAHAYAGECGGMAWVVWR